MRLLAVILIASSAYAQDLMYSVASLLATDLSNANRSVFSVRVETSDPDVSARFSEYAGRNLCESKAFRSSVGEFICRRGVSYQLTDSEAYDALVTDTCGTVAGKVLTVGVRGGDGCDVRVRDGRIMVDFKALGARGFVPDPVSSTAGY